MKISGWNFLFLYKYVTIEYVHLHIFMEDKRENVPVTNYFNNNGRMF